MNVATEDLKYQLGDLRQTVYADAQHKQAIVCAAKGGCTKLEYERCRDALDGFYAYDTGSINSGIQNESLRAEIRAYLTSLDPVKHRETISKVVIDLCLSHEALMLGYGPEDAKEFLTWLDDQDLLIAI